MLRTSLFQQLFAVMFIIVFFGFGVAVDSVSNKRRDAELLVRRMVGLKMGTSSFNAARELAEEYGGKPTSGGPARGDCSAQACTFTFVIDNKPLSYIPGVSAVEFVATLNRTGADFAYLLVDHLDPHGLEIQKLKVDADGMPHVLKVNLGRSATADERQRAYSIGLSCLARLGGCRHAAAIFPAGL